MRGRGDAGTRGHGDAGMWRRGDAGTLGPDRDTDKGKG
jgi:hypothetical protein